MVTQRLTRDMLSLHITTVFSPVWIFYSSSVGLQGENTTVIMTVDLEVSLYSLSLSHVYRAYCFHPLLPKVWTRKPDYVLLQIGVHRNSHHMVTSEWLNKCCCHCHFYCCCFLLLSFHSNNNQFLWTYYESISNSICCWYGIDNAGQPGVKGQ